MISEFDICGVGNLVELSTDTPFEDCVLIHGENGVGKSTLAAVFRALETADAQSITDRKTVGQDIAAKIEFKAGKDSFAFDEDKWSAALPELCVFDQSFVNRNVHSGDQMNNEHGKKLYSIILGESCGELLDQAAKVEDEVDDHNKSLRSLTKDLESRIPNGLTLEQFIALPKSNSAEDQIRRLEEKLETHRKRKKLDRAQMFLPIELPSLSESFEQVLKKSISNILDDAEGRVYDHIESSTKKANVAWIEDGCEFSNDDDCPFCGEPIADNKLIAAYKSFFSRDYNTLKAEINSLDGLIDSAFGERVIVGQQKVLSENSASRQFWEDYVEVPPLDESIFEEVDDDIGRTRDKLQDLAEQKRRNPLEALEIDFDLELRSSLQERIDDYNTLVEAANERIVKLRESQAEGTADEDAAKLVALKATGARYEPEVVKLIEDWDKASKEKDAIAKKRKDLQKKIRKETKAVFETRGEQINELLTRMDAGFTLGQFDTNNRTKPPSVQIRVCFNGAESVRLDDKVGKTERPFDSALSSGQRNMLAFAFFMSGLSQDESIGDKTVVIDDPITNLDERRLTTTAEIVAGLDESTKQLIILSHNTQFLDVVAENIKDAQRHQLSFSKGANQLKTVKAFD